MGDDGGVRANIDLVGIEHEGIAATRITDAQVDALARLYRWLQAEHGFGPYQTRVTVYEHNWVSDEPTACPSGRIRHADVNLKIAELEEEMANDAEVTRLKSLLVVTNLFLDAAEHAVAGTPLPPALKAQLIWLLAG